MEGNDATISGEAIATTVIAAERTTSGDAAVNVGATTATTTAATASTAGQVPPISPASIASPSPSETEVQHIFNQQFDYHMHSMHIDASLNKMTDRLLI